MKKLAIVILSAFLLLTGCQTNDTPTEDVNQPEEENIEDEVVQDEEIVEDVEDSAGENLDTSKYENIEVSVQDAFDIFMDKYPNAKINEIELEKEDNAYEYEIEGYEGNKEYEIKIHAFTKEILEKEVEKENDEEGEITRESLDKIENYVSQALEYAGEGYWVEEWQLKAKSDYTEFEIELESNNGDDLKYKFDHESGVLLEKQ